MDKASRKEDFPTREHNKNCKKRIIEKGLELTEQGWTRARIAEKIERKWLISLFSKKPEESKKWMAEAERLKLEQINSFELRKGNLLWLESKHKIN